MADVKPRRAYRSEVRLEQAAATRRRVLDAALPLFGSDGFHSTTMEAIAAAAGVAVPTVYKAFGTKGDLLRAAVARALAGDEDREPLMHRPWWQEQLDEPDSKRQLALIARNARAIWERAASVVDMLRTAASLDSETADVWESVNQDRMERSKVTARNLRAKGQVRPNLSTTALADVLATMTSLELYLQLVRDRGWAPRRYEEWLADALQALILKG